MRRIILLLLLPMFSFAQTRQSGGISFTPQWNYKISGSDTTWQFGNTLMSPQQFPFILTKWQSDQRYATAAGYVPITRLVSTGIGLLGGGNLGSNLTLYVDTVNIVSKTYSARWLTQAGAASLYQPLNAKLTAIAALANSAGVLTNNGSGGFSYVAPSTGTVTSITPGYGFTSSTPITTTGTMTIDTTKLLTVTRYKNTQDTLYNKYFQNIHINGASGTGYINLANTSSVASTPSSGINLFSRTTNRLSMVGANGFEALIGTTAYTVGHFVNYPDASGFLMTNPLTTTGDIPYLSASSSTGANVARLGIGSTGSFLTPISGVPAWSSIITPAVAFQTPTGTTGTDSIAVKIGSTGKMGAIAGSSYLQSANNLSDVTNPAKSFYNIGGATLSFKTQNDYSVPEIAPSAFTGTTYDQLPCIAQYHSGKYVMVFVGSTSHSVGGDLMYSTSTDNKTWTTPIVILHEAGINLTNIAIFVTPTDRLDVVFTRQATGPIRSLGLKHIYTDDEGGVWSSPAVITNNAVDATGNIAIGANNKILIPVYAETTINKAQVISTSDNFTTFSVPITISDTTGITGTNETGIAYLGSGNWVSLSRQSPSAGHLIQNQSSDNGVTWTHQGATTFDGSVPSIVSPYGSTYQSSNGRKMVTFVYANRRAPYAIKAITASAKDIINSGLTAWQTASLDSIAPSTGDGNSDYPTLVHPNNSMYALGVQYYGSSSITHPTFFVYPSTGQQPFYQGDYRTDGNIVKSGVIQPHLTGSITSNGNYTSLADSTGTGTKVVKSISPTLTTPTADNLTLTGVNAVVSATGATTNGAYAKFANTGGDARFGVNNSTGNLGSVNGRPYSTFISSAGATNIEFAISGGVAGYFDGATSNFINKQQISTGYGTGTPITDSLLTRHNGIISSIPATYLPLTGGTLTGAATFSQTSPTAATVYDGFINSNTTAATSGNQQYSSALHLISQGWQTGTGASQQYDWRIYDTPIQSAAGSHNLLFTAQTAGGGYTTPLTLTGAGALTALGSISGTGFSASSGTSGFAYTTARTLSNATTVRGYFNNDNNSFTSNTSTTYYGAGISPQIGAANTGNWTASAGSFGALQANPVTVAGATGTVTRGFGLWSIFTNSATGLTFTDYANIIVDNPQSTGPITKLAGLAVAQQTKGTGNINLLLGTTTHPGGNWSEYNSSSYANYINGTLQIGSATPTAGTPKLDVTGSIGSTTLTANSPVYADANKVLTTTAPSTVTELLRYAHTIFTPTTGGTVALVNNQYNIINPAAAILALTVNLPSSPANNDVVYIKFTQTVSTVTYGNGTVVDGITAPTAGGLTILVYDSGTTSWY